jgi:hypothetical protein
MGTATNAILFYGYCWEDEASWPWDVDDSSDEDDEEYSWHERYARMKGLTDEAARPFIAKEPCTVETHCSGECPMPYVAIKASTTLAWRGHPQEIRALRTDPAWNKQLAAFCKLLDINIKGKKAAWWLVSDWT